MHADSSQRELYSCQTSCPDIIFIPAVCRGKGIPDMEMNGSTKLGAGGGPGGRQQEISHLQLMEITEI